MKMITKTLYEDAKIQGLIMLEMLPEEKDIELFLETNAFKLPPWLKWTQLRQKVRNKIVCNQRKSLMLSAND